MSHTAQFSLGVFSVFSASLWFTPPLRCGIATVIRMGEPAGRAAGSALANRRLNRKMSGCTWLARRFVSMKGEYAPRPARTGRTDYRSFAGHWPPNRGPTRETRATLALTARSADDLATVAADARAAGTRAETFPGDLTRADDRERIVSQAVAHFGQVGRAHQLRRRVQFRRVQYVHRGDCAKGDGGELLRPRR